MLGIDAAWTERQPSGVALAAADGGCWRLLAVEPSYPHFLARADGRKLDARPAGARPDPAALVVACLRLSGQAPDMVAIDMPLSAAPIRGRRESDDAISRAFGAQGAGTHSPSAERPGALSDALRQAFAESGYALRTAGPSGPGLIEVYPHPALIRLLQAPRRLPYKAGKTRAYWPDLDRAARRAALLGLWSEIVARLDHRIAGVAAALPAPGPDCAGAALKAYEDQLDAVICAWIGLCVLDGRAAPFGDAVSAIWVPEKE